MDPLERTMVAPQRCVTMPLLDTICLVLSAARFGICNNSQKLYDDRTRLRKGTLPRTNQKIWRKDHLKSKRERDPHEQGRSTEVARQRTCSITLSPHTCSNPRRTPKAASTLVGWKFQIQKVSNDPIATHGRKMKRSQARSRSDQGLTFRGSFCSEEKNPRVYGV